MCGMYEEPLSLYIMRVAFIYLFYVWCFLLSICQAQNVKEKWSAESVTLFTTWASLSVLDARQTFHMEEFRKYYDDLEPISYAHEVNPLIGKNPTKDRVVMVKVLSGALTYYGLNKMKEKNRKKALIGFNIFYFIIVLHNASLGLRI
jgi:hypothetical protein